MPNYDKNTKAQLIKQLNHQEKRLLEMVTANRTRIDREAEILAKREQVARLNTLLEQSSSELVNSKYLLRIKTEQHDQLQINLKAANINNYALQQLLIAEGKVPK